MGQLNVSIARYLLGLASLAVVAGSLGVAAVALRRRLLPAQSGALALLSAWVIGVALLVAILELLGTIGLFRLAPVVLACLVAGGAITAWAGTARERARAGPRAPVRAGAFALALAVGALVAAEWANPTLGAYDYGIRTFDSLWYHLPWAAGFAQSGQITPLHFDLQFLLAFYPATGELLHGLGILALGRDTLSPALNLLWLGLALLAAWCIGRPKGRGALSVLGVALVVGAPMMYFSQPGSADDDIVGTFLLLASVALLLGDDGAIVLAGVAAGLAIEIKLSLLAPVFLLTVGMLVTAPRDRRGATAARWLGPLAVAGGFWYLRNLIAIGNPLPWSSFGVLPTPAPPLQQHNTASIAHYVTDSRFWSHFFEAGMASQLGRWWWAILALAVIGPLLCLGRGSSPRLRMLALVALGGLAAYIVTPNSAMGPPGDPVGFAYNLRFAAPPLALALALLPLAPVFDARPRLQWSLGIALGLTLLATVTESSLWPGRHTAAVVGVAMVVLGGGVGLAWVGHRSRYRLGALGLAVAAAAIAAAGYPVQRHYLSARYTFRPSVSHLSGVWAYFRRVHHARVGLAGSYGEFFAYPLTGLDDTNVVRYIAHHGPHGSFTPIASCREWRRAVNRGHLRYLITTPERDFWRPAQLRPAPEGAWTRSDPAAQLLFSRRVTGQPVDVFALHGRLNPASCN
jgi:hypothetical protein